MRHMSGTCEQCNELFTAARENARFCSTKCLSAWHYAQRTQCKMKTCPGCGQLKPIRYDATYCSRECHTRWINSTRKAVVFVPRDQVRIDVATQPTPERRRTFVAGRCRRCGDSFIATRLRARGDLYCSGRCSHADAKARRQAAKTKAFVENVYRYQVFERDNYICQLCMTPCRIDVDYTHMQSPTIDHTVPLARGGQHSMANVQTAHRLCNSLKSDRLDFVVSMA